MRERLSVDLVSLGAGALIAALGVLVLLDSSGALAIPLGWMAVALTGAVGAICLLSGLLDGDAKRHD
jgi:6,7-dimethyl-8-ribityllumazine synthase